MDRDKRKHQQQDEPNPGVDLIPLGLMDISVDEKSRAMPWVTDSAPLELLKMMGSA